MISGGNSGLSVRPFMRRVLDINALALCKKHFKQFYWIQRSLKLAVVPASWSCSTALCFLLLLDGAIASRAVIAIASGSDERKDGQIRFVDTAK